MPARDRKSPEREFLHALSTPMSTAFTLVSRLNDQKPLGEAQLASLARAMEQMIQLVRDRRAEIHAAEAAEVKEEGA